MIYTYIYMCVYIYNHHCILQSFQPTGLSFGQEYHLGEGEGWTEQPKRQVKAMPINWLVLCQQGGQQGVV